MIAISVGKIQINISPLSEWPAWGQGWQTTRPLKLPDPSFFLHPPGPPLSPHRPPWVHTCSMGGGIRGGHKSTACLVPGGWCHPLPPRGGGCSSGQWERLWSEVLEGIELKTSTGYNDPHFFRKVGKPFHGDPNSRRCLPPGAELWAALQPLVGPALQPDASQSSTATIQASFKSWSRQ